MALGPSNATWTQLYKALARLAGACGGAFAFVLDEGNGLWCVGLADVPPTTATHVEDRAADRFYAAEIVPRTNALRKGSHIEIVCEEGNDRYMAVSFAGIYVVVVWFYDGFGADLVRARIRRALPEIERLTLSLPPSGGPGADEGAARARA
ncbi:MAG: hypothetical protein KF819_28765 [Labilithrix sp.]|nr:hypothetical protein [Labilithrix sp.]